MGMATLTSISRQRWVRTRPAPRQNRRTRRHQLRTSLLRQLMIEERLPSAISLEQLRLGLRESLAHAASQPPLLECQHRSRPDESRPPRADPTERLRQTARRTKRRPAWREPKRLPKFRLRSRWLTSHQPPVSSLKLAWRHLRTMTNELRSGMRRIDLVLR